MSSSERRPGCFPVTMSDNSAILPARDSRARGGASCENKRPAVYLHSKSRRCDERSFFFLKQSILDFSIWLRP